MKYIYAKDLIKINDLKSFDSAKAILFIDLLEMPDWYPLFEAVVVYNNKKYLKICMTGKPENFTPGKRFDFNTPAGIQLYSIDYTSLDDLIKNGGIYDISKFYRDLKYCQKTEKGYAYNLKLSNQFIIDTFLLPYLK